MKGICHIWSRGRHFSPSLPGDRYLKLGSKSDLRAEISGSIVRYDALAPRPEVLLLWHFVRACAATLELRFFPYSWRNYPDRVNLIQRAADVIYWGEFLQQVLKNFSLLLRSSLRCRKQVGKLLSWVKPWTSDTEPGVVEVTIRVKEQPGNDNDLEPSTTIAGKLETTT